MKSIALFYGRIVIYNEIIPTNAFNCYCFFFFAVVWRSLFILFRNKLIKLSSFCVSKSFKTPKSLPLF
ncbi:hypothetical protein MWE_1173 [Helicobacter pylori XZ274]|nr:hypothetical protein MWE_1173 [Helicobacter pylori XZ274]